MKLKTFLVAAMAAMVSLGSWAQTWTGNEVGAGTFYLYNVGAAKYLNNGDPNSEWGTNAYLQAGFGMDVVLANVGENLYTIDTNVSNGGDSHYMNNSTWTDGAATQWTFRAVAGETNTYQIIYNGEYLMANEALNDVEMVGDPGSRVTSTYWKLVSEQDFKDAMVAKTYSTEDPMDVSVFIKGRSFARNDGRNTSWVTTHNGGNWTWIGSSANKYYGNESWNNTFDVHQAITGLPEGTYEVRCSGFGTNGTTYIYGNSTSKAIQTDNTTSYGTDKAAKWKAIHEDNAFADQSTGTFTVGDGNLTVGIKREKNNGGDWAIWDEFRLYYYGLDLSEFSTALADAVAAAEAVEGTVPTAVYNTLAAVVEEQNQTYTSASAYQAATNAIISATNTAKDLQASYARYTSVKTAILAINSGIDLSAADTQANDATTNDAIGVAVVTARTALSTYLASAGITNDQIDLTAALIDNAAPGIAGNLEYWTNSGTPGLQYQLFEYWNVSAGTTKQTIATELPAGYYTLTAIAYTRDNMTATLHAGEHTLNLVGCGAVNDRNGGSNWIAQGGGVNELTFQLTEATSNLEIGLTADNTTGDHWMCWRSFKLEYLGTAPLVLFQKQLEDAATAAESHATALSGTIPAASSTAYTNAINTAKAANTTIDACLQSISDIEAATATADALVAPYAAYQLAVSDATFVGVASETISEQNAAVEAATTVDGITACTTALTTAIDAVESHDITAYTIKNPTAQTKTDWEGTDFGSQSDNVCEYWNKSGADFHQTINLPVGKYCLTVIALQRTNMTGIVYAGENRTTIAQVASGTVSSRSAASTWFNAGNGVNHVFFEVTGETKDVVIGLTADATTGDHWTVWKSFALATYDESVAASYLKPGYDDAMAAAVAYQTAEMFDEDKTALNTAISDNTVEEASATIAAYETAIANLNAATTAAATAVANYTQYTAVVAAIGENTNVDLTSFVTNGDFELNNLNGWTSVDGGNVANNGNFNSTYFVERWKNGVALGSGSLTHDAIVLPAGVYHITADAQNIEQYNSAAAGTGLFLCANAEQTEIGAKGNYDVYVKVADKEALTIKFLQDNCTGNWIAYDNVTLTYVAADYAYTVVDGKMKATVAAAQTSAVEAFEAAQTAANYKALVAAIAAAQASKDAYTAAAAALTKANSILNSTNVYTAEARTAYADAIAAAQAAYDDASMDDATANGLNAALNNADWGAAQPTGAAYIGSAWTGTNINYNFWSWEGDGEGASGMSTPFIQAWVADAEKLADNNISATLSGLENGLYSVTAFVRVFNNKEGDDAGYDGISLAVNEGAPVAFADATEYTDGYAKEITAEGLVKGGILTIKVAVENTNASWLAFKNVNYTKLRDLTPEEEAIAPTAIALYNGEEEVTENIILNGSETTVTLTTSLTPAEATLGFIEWESADETVATVVNGVIKANGTGTTTITAKSKIDPSVTATATVVAYAFQNQSFEADGNQAAGNSTNPNMITITGWTQEQNTAGSYQDNQLRDASTDNASNYGKRVTPSNGSYYFFYRHGWNGSNYAKLTSEAQNLPIGKYTLTVDYKMVAGSDNTSNNDNTAITLSAISGETTLATTTKNDATKANNNSSTAYLVNEGWKTVSTSFTIEEETSVQAVINLLACGPKRSDFVVDNVTLTWSSFKDALKDAIDVAEAVDVTTNVGDAAFQIPASAVSTFTSAISDAQGVYDNAESTESNYLDAIKALNNAKTAYADSELNAPEAEQLYNIVVATADHAKENNPIIIIPGATSANNPTGYALNANFEANSNLSQAFTFTKVEGNTYKISAKVAGVDVYLTNGTLNGSAAGWKNSQIQATTDAEMAMAFKVGTSDVDGAFVIYNTETNSTIACQTGGNIYTETGNAYFKLVETAKPSIAINTTAAGWGTVMLPFAQALPEEGVKAYSVSETNGNVLTLVEAEALEANKPYIIEGEWDDTVEGDAQGTALTYTDGLLTGTYAQMAAPNESYILQKHDGVVGFYQVNIAEAQPNVPANRAYLTVASNDVKAFFLFGGDADAIKSVFDSAAKGDIFDLSGRKVEKMQKGGIYVINGKKVMVK